MRSRPACVIGIVLGLACHACGDRCIDADGDGYGKNCKAGPDCNDHDPKLTRDCGALGQMCAKNAYAENCPCYVGEHRSCYSGADATLDVGACRGGEQVCSGGRWTACDGEVGPAFEICNGRDDDCDGRIDEGVLSPCGGCDDSCVGGVWGPPSVPFESGGDLALTAGGELTLALEPLDARTVWVPNTGEATLSKVDADTARELARYRVAGDSPERVAIDFNADAWVLSPALSGQSMLTKVASMPGACDPARTTSQAPDAVLALGDDGCVLLQANVGAEDEIARTLAIDGSTSADGELGGNVWVGMQASERVLVLDGRDASVVREVATPGLAPFAASFDPWGVLWLVDRDGHLGKIDPTSDPPSVSVLPAPLACYTLDSIVSDAEGTLTMTGASCEDVVVYHPDTDRWQTVAVPSLLDARAAAVLDAATFVTHTAGSISRFSGDPLAYAQSFALASDGVSPLESIAIGADSLGKLWIVSSMGGSDGHGVLTRFDPQLGMVDAMLSIGRLPRAEGDITGDRRLGVFAPQASASHVFTGCNVPELDSDAAIASQPTDWLRVHLAWSGAPGASIVVEARNAGSAAELAAASFVELGTLPDDPEPYAVPFARGGLVEVRLTLRTTERHGAPRVSRVGLEWRCPGPS